jgi:hypothetical protein
VSLVSHVPHFPGSLTRKWYRKKIPENALNVTQVTRYRSKHLDKVDKRYSISGKSYEKIVQEKDPGIRESFVQRVQILRNSPHLFPRLLRYSQSASASSPLRELPAAPNPDGGGSGHYFASS